MDMIIAARVSLIPRFLGRLSWLLVGHFGLIEDGRRFLGMSFALSYIKQNPLSNWSWNISCVIFVNIFLCFLFLWACGLVTCKYIPFFIKVIGKVQ
ncbi:hypothetical protein HU200_065889 [Digitaria exilis]|uniref:Uncharacterized protein n=1 Tax=Digitaria exilis TaxID=1010633 RepID=A0A835DXH8_9POAL|nr:hypothetical protein HU200_065889 [Digitaria exilis]